MLHLLPFLALLWSLSVPAQGQGASTIAPARIFEALGAKEGMTVCEIGAGSGELSIAVAKLVGESGRVFTSELGDERVKALQANIKKSGLAHITVVAGDAGKTNFPDAACDALFMRNVYHHFADPAAMNRSIAAAVKPGARYAVVDFTPPPGGEAKDPADRAKDGSHGVGPDSVSRELKDAGFEAVTADTSGQRWFMVVVTKPKSGFRFSFGSTLFLPEYPESPRLRANADDVEAGAGQQRAPRVGHLGPMPEAMSVEWGEGEADVGVRVETEVQELSLRPQHARRFAERAGDVLPRQVIDGKGAERRVERTGLKRQLAHVADLHVHPIGDARGARVRHQSIRRVVLDAEVALVKIEAGHFRVRSLERDHERRAA